MLGASRVLIFLVAVATGLGGLFAISSGELEGTVAGIALLVVAAVLVLAVQYERMRYRSDTSEGARAASGPGGESGTALLEPRFERTNEVFVDPSSGKRMRVHLDPRTGERRYQPES